MFFEDSWPKYLIVLLVALIVIGPKELPAMLRMFGRLLGQLRRHADEFRRHFDDTVREAGGDELKRELDQLRQHNPITQFKNTIEEAAREVTHPPLTFEPPPTAPASTAPNTASTPATPPAETAAPMTQKASSEQAVTAAPDSSARSDEYRAPAATLADRSQQAPTSAATDAASIVQPRANGADRQQP